MQADAERKLSKMSGEVVTSGVVEQLLTQLQHKNLTAQTDLLAQLREQMRSLDSQILIYDASVSDFKRSSTRQFMTLKFGGLVELAEKITVSDWFLHAKII